MDYLPDFELSELWLCPRFSTVDLGEVEPVRLQVDVHGVHTQQTHRSALFHDYKKAKIKVCIFCFFYPEFSSLTLPLKVRVQRQHHPVSLPEWSPGYKALPPGRHPPLLRLLRVQHIQSPLLPGTEQAH